jgi:hypothetical protein
MSSETAITISSRRVASIVAFTATGMLSGILTASSLAFLDALNPFAGAIFGVAIAIALSLWQREWSAGRIIAFVASSVMAYFAAIWSPTLAIYVLRALANVDDRSVPEMFGPVMFSLAGFVGAFVIMLAVLLLFFQAKGRRVPARALLLALPGVLLGLISATASQSVQEIVGHWFSPSASWGWKPEQFYSAYLIWQTGMGFVIAALLSRNTALSVPEQHPPTPRSQMKLTVGAKVFTVCVLAGTAVTGFFEGRARYRESQQYGRIEKPREPTPSTENLPQVPPRPIEQALILKGISGYAESGAELSAIPAQREYWKKDLGGSSRAAVPRVLYSICYQKPGTTNGRSTSVTAQVWEYPNAAWAKYQLRSTPFGDPPIVYSGQIKTVTKFGNPVLINALAGGPIPYVYWASTNRVIVLHYSGQEDDEFVRQYLDKYPSSL